MNLKHMLVKIVAAAVMTGSVMAGEGWLTDFEAAKALAKKENKDLLMEFTGSDWCPPCQALAKEIFDKEEFVKEAQKYFVLLKLDYPQEKELPADEKKQNEMLAVRYGIQAYPTVLLADDSGMPYALAGGVPLNLEAYLEMLYLSRAKKEKLAKEMAEARKLEGKDKARAMERSFANKYGLAASMAHEEILKEILAADPESVMVTKVMGEAEMATASTKAEAEAAFKKYDTYVAKSGTAGMEKQMLMVRKLNVLERMQDWDGMRAYLDEIIAVDPDSEVGKNLSNNARPWIDKLEQRAKESAKKADEAKEPAAAE